MQFWLSERHQNRRLCLIYDNGALVTWACIGLDDLDVSSWTLKGYRKRGYAQASIWALLNREKTSRRSRLWTYSPSTCRIVRRLGYKSTYKV